MFGSQAPLDLQQRRVRPYGFRTANTNPKPRPTEVTNISGQNPVFAAASRAPGPPVRPPCPVHGPKTGRPNAGPELRFSIFGRPLLFFGTFFRWTVFFFQNPETWPKTDFSGLFRVAESVRAGHIGMPAEVGW